MKISKILLSSVAATAFAGAVASSAVTALNPELTRDSEMAFNTLGVVGTAQTIGTKALSADRYDTLAVKGLPEDKYTISISQDHTNPYTQGNFGQGVLGTGTNVSSDLTGTIDGTNYSNSICQFRVAYNANYDATKAKKLGAALKPDVATVNVTLKEHCDDALKYTKSHTVVGTLPTMSFTNSEVPGENMLYVGGDAKSFDEDLNISKTFTAQWYKKGQRTIYFVLAGYIGDNYSQANPTITKVEPVTGDASQFTCTIEKVADNDTKVSYYTKDGGVAIPYAQSCAAYWESKGFKGQLYRAVLNYNPEEGGHEVKTKFTIGDSLDINALTITAYASDAQIATTTERIDFPQEGGVEYVEIAYTGFEAPSNKGYRIHAKMDSYYTAPFKAEFVDIPDQTGVEVRSAKLEGTGKIKLAVKCAPFDEADPTQVNDDVLIIWINDKEIQIPVTRTKPSLSLLNASDAAKEIVLGEEIDDVKKEVTFVVRNLLNYYDIDDIEIMTSNDAFQVYNVSRVHIKDVDVDYGVTVTVLYTPFCDNKDVTGTLYIRNKETGETIPVALKGIAKVNAKGYTGVENAVAADAAGAAYNVAGAAVNGNAKGVTIVNGKKYNK